MYTRPTTDDVHRPMPIQRINGVGVGVADNNARTHQVRMCMLASASVRACVIHLNMRICTDASHGLYTHTHTHGCAIVRVCIKVRACFSGKSPFPMILFGMRERVCVCVCMRVFDAHARLTPSPNSSCIRDYGIRVCVCVRV